MSLPVHDLSQIRFEELTYAHPSGEEVFSGVSFDFPLNKVVGVDSAASGGKSTLLKLLCALVQPQEGQLLINGQAVGDMSFAEFVPYRLKIGYGFDLGGLLNNRTLRENILLPLIYHGLCSPKAADRRVDQWIERMEMGAVQHERPSGVSGSRRKVTCLIRAMIHEPELLLLDEPTVGLSSHLVEEFKRALEEERQKGRFRHVFFVSSDERLLGKGFSQGQLFIQEGKLDWRPQVEEVSQQ